MSYLTTPVQSDFIDYMLSHHGEVPVLDRALHERALSEQQLHIEGVDVPHEETDDENLLDEVCVNTANRFMTAN